MSLIAIATGLLGCLVGALVSSLIWRKKQREFKALLVAEQAVRTGRFEAERGTLLQAQAQQRALFESMAEGVLLLDVHRRITMANKSFRELLRVTGEIRGKTILEAVRIPLLAEMAGQLPEKDVFRNSELELPGSPPRVLEVNASVVADHNGQNQGAIFVFHDLTKLKQLENTRRDFVANVSHELRTPLSLIKGFVETLLDGAADEPEQNERFLRTIQKHTNRLTYLIEDLLTISSLEIGPVILNLEPVVLAELAGRVIDDLRVRSAARNIHIDNRIAVGLKVHADADRLQQVISNLVENAIKYGRADGKVTVTSELMGSSQVRISVQDDGPGIPAEAQARVFERFYRVDRARSRESGGTGLGLAIVKHIVQAHGGTVGVSSEPGQGSHFFFTLRTARPAPGPQVSLKPAQLFLTRQASATEMPLSAAKLTW